MPFLMAQTQSQSTLPPLTPDNVQQAFGYGDAVVILIFVAGLPLLIREIIALYRRRGLGPTLDRAWPAAGWTNSSFGAIALAYIALVIHSAVSFLTAAIALQLGIITPPDAAAAGNAEAAASQLQQVLAVIAVVSVDWILIAASVIFWIRHVKRSPLAALGFTLPRPAQSIADAFRILFAAMPLILALSVFSYFIYRTIQGTPPQAHDILQAVAPGKTQSRHDLIMLILVFIATTVVIPFFEEFFYRGFIQNTLMRTGRPWLAIILSSVIFAAVHLGNADGLTSFLPLLALALALGYAFYRTRSLLTCWLMHMLFNAFNLALVIFTS